MTAATASPPTTGRRPLELWLVLAAFVAVWTLVPLIARWPAAIWDDTMEAWTWGQAPQLGYYKLPPFYAWIAAAWFRLLPPGDLGGYLLSAATGAIGLLAVWHIAGRFVAGAGPLAAVLLATTLPTATAMATLFNANTILLALWPWTTLLFLRTLERRRAADGAMLGALAAAGLLSKYSSALLLAPMLAAALLHPDRRAWFRSPAPYTAAAVCLLLLAPHVWWLVANDFPTFKYAAGKVTDDGSRALYKAATVAATAVGLMLPPVLAVLLALGRDGAALLVAGARRLATPADAWLLALLAGPLVLTLLSGVVGGVRLAPNYLIPTLFLVPVWVCRAVGDQAAERALSHVRRFAAGYAALALLVAPGLAYGGMALQLRKFSDPVKEAVTTAQELWRQQVGRPVGIASGTELYAHGLAYYGADRPQQFTQFDLGKAPWITPRRIAEEGLLAVCVKDDPECGRIGAYLTPRTLRFERTLQKTFLGRAGKPVKLEIIVIPPAR